MKLYQLFPDFTKLSSFERMLFLRSYREKRARELEESIKSKRKGKAKSSFTQEERDLMKSLGIKMKDLAALKEIL